MSEDRKTPVKDVNAPAAVSAVNLTEAVFLIPRQLTIAGASTVFTCIF